MQTRKRPKSLTVIAVIIIVVGAPFAILSIAGLPVTSSLGEIGLLILFGAGQLISGIAVLKGLNWGRWLYLCIYPPVMVVQSWESVYGLAFDSDIGKIIMAFVEQPKVLPLLVYTLSAL